MDEFKKTNRGGEPGSLDNYNFESVALTHYIAIYTFHVWFQEIYRCFNLSIKLQFMVDNSNRFQNHS